jgi:hypothetical protein
MAMTTFLTCLMAIAILLAMNSAEGMDMQVYVWADMLQQALATSNSYH